MIYKQVNSFYFDNDSNEESVSRKKPKKLDPAPDFDEESIPRKKPKKLVQLVYFLVMVGPTCNFLVRRCRIPRGVIIRMRIVSSL